MPKEKNKFQKVTDEPVIMPETEETVEAPKTNNNVAKRPQPKNTWIPIAVGIIVLIGLGVGAYFLLNKPANKPDNTTTGETTEEPEEELTDEERLAKYDDEIAASTEETHLPLVIEKATRQVALQQYEEALETLSGISESGLEDLQLYQLYAAYIYLYTSKGDDKEVEEYTNKSDAIYQKLEAAGVFATAEETGEVESAE